MESWLPFVGIIILLGSVPLVNAYVAARTGKTSLRREVLVRVWIFLVMFVIVEIQSRDWWMPVCFFASFIIGMGAWAQYRYPVTESTYRAMYEERRKRMNRDFQKQGAK